MASSISFSTCDKIHFHVRNFALSSSGREACHVQPLSCLDQLFRVHLFVLEDYFSQRYVFLPRQTSGSKGMLSLLLDQRFQGYTFCLVDQRFQGYAFCLVDQQFQGYAFCLVRLAVPRVCFLLVRLSILWLRQGYSFMSDWTSSINYKLCLVRLVVPRVRLCVVQTCCSESSFICLNRFIP